MCCGHGARDASVEDGLVRSLVVYASVSDSYFPSKGGRGAYRNGERAKSRSGGVGRSRTARYAEVTWNATTFIFSERGE